MRKNKKIVISNLYKSFGNKKVLRGVTLDIYEGESMVIIGGSGAGKSVLIKNIAALLDPDKGAIMIDNKNIHKASKPNKASIISKMGYLFQGGALFDSNKIWENVGFKLIQEKQSAQFVQENVKATLKSVGLSEDVMNLYPSELSGGMQKRASLARAVISKPEIIFFDEPTTGLDPIMAENIDNLILEQTKRLGATAVTITHDIASVRKIADRVAMLHQGQIIWVGTIKELDRSKNEIVKNFINGRIN
jgi:phospholipid/cholesterol/gamma-HCH transport system ATP-binding protein